ncbi:roadblock/LC7 domain-containing protein [Ralstonia pseudosolanacearum]|uniref:roadblock/LC7 domain-containing protein n=2 Tax=Ralstonia pseudosolanacearum TaxID=1310165 RepID=UPI000694AA65|nr:roadblock/LC7 domain-containing protein [Ralstonia pseudosolanacearum]
MTNPLTQPAMAGRVRSILRNLQTSSTHIEACAVVTLDGFLVASVMADGVNADRFAAMCASLLTLASRAAKEISRGDLRQIILDGSEGKMLLIHAGDRGLLAVAGHPMAQLGKLILDARSAARELAGLGGDPS